MKLGKNWKLEPSTLSALSKENTFFAVQKKGFYFIMRLITQKPDSATLVGPASKLLKAGPMLEGKVTSLPGLKGLLITPSKSNIQLLQALFPEMVIEAAKMGSDADFDFPCSRPQYFPRTTPFDHQKRALNKSRGKRAFFLLMEQGTGKTKVAIDECGELWSEGLIDAVIVFSRKDVHKQWIKSQLPEHFGAPWEGAFWENKKWRFVKPPKKAKDVCHWRAINFDAVKYPAGEEAAKEFIRAHRGRIAIIADETQEIKSHNSTRHKVLTELRNLAMPKKILALTGTPIATDLTDEWAQLRWLDPSILNVNYVTAFRTEYCIMGGFENKKVIGQKNLARFRQKVDPFTFRATKEELGLLPPLQRRWVFDPTTLQRAMIKAIKEELSGSSMQGFARDNEIGTALLRMQQIVCGFTPEGRLPNNPRIDALLEVLEAYPGKTIIWHRFKMDAQMIKEALEKAGETAVFFNGETSSQDRSSAVESWLDPEGPRLFVANPQAAGTGLNLQTGGCTHAIYYSNSFRAIDRWQSQDRIHRIGTKGQVVYTDLVAKGCQIDQMILSNLAKKKGLSEMAIGDLVFSFNQTTAEEWEYETE